MHGQSDEASASTERYMEIISTRFLYAVSALPRHEIEKLLRLVEFLATEIQNHPDSED